jgi:hypothetical protein
MFTNGFMKRLFFYTIVILGLLALEDNSGNAVTLFNNLNSAGAVGNAPIGLPYRKPERRGAVNALRQRAAVSDTGKLIGADSARWLEDLAFYREKMPETHGNLFHKMTGQQFNDSITLLGKKIPGLTVNQAKSAILRLVAMVGDGHTRVRQETLGEHMLPVRLYYFADGLYVESAEKAYQNILGCKVERIGNMTAENVYAAVRDLIPVDGDNEYRRHLMAPEFMVNPEILTSVGAIKTAQTVAITVQKGGQHFTVTLPAGLFRPWNNHGWPVDGPGWVNARLLSGKPAPLWLEHTNKAYWYRFLPGGEILYIQFNEVADQQGAAPIAKFFPLLIKEADEKKVERVVLDVRLNGGGNNELNRPIWHALLKSDRLNRKGKLWVITGPKTFSAATSLVDELELNTHATFIGQPTGESPNQWGDPRDIKLPNSGIVIQASTIWWQLEDPRDHRSFRKPDISVGMSFNDYKNGLDPVLETIERVHK